MSETIPIDIMDVAEQAAADLDDIHFNSRSASWLDDARDIVARALMAERERCAKIAEDKDWSVGGLMHVDTAPIASAIRTPSTGEEQMSMVEKVARAIIQNKPRETVEMTDEGWVTHIDYEATARAAIEAMREADNDMLEAMHNAMLDAPAGTMLEAGFEAAIDAALT